MSERHGCHSDDPQFGERGSYTRESSVATLFAMNGDEGTVSPGVARYWARIDVWMQARGQAGGTLSQEDEVAHMSAVDEIYRSLTEDEKEQLERHRRP